MGWTLIHPAAQCSGHLIPPPSDPAHHSYYYNVTLSASPSGAP
jgi:hypothetical protein